VDTPPFPLNTTFNHSSEPCLTNQQINSIVPFREYDPKFVYYLMLHNVEKVRAIGIGGGSATPIVNKTLFSRITVKVPSKREQNHIASLLSAYDDLIENNRRRIQLLEQSARLLYKEWFVRLRFPGHERVKIKNGVPEGWQIVALGDVAEINKASLGKNYQGEIEYIDISAVTPGMINKTTCYKFSDAPSRARRIVSHGDIIWSCVRPNRRSHAVVWNPAANLIASTGFAVLTPIALPTTYLYQAVTTDEFVGYLSNNARGAAYPAVTSSDFEIANILLPKRNILGQFNIVAESILEEIQVLRQQSIKLAQARDILLPRLMNGEIIKV
jgi:type I restriction enzyme S subunit